MLPKPRQARRKPQAGVPGTRSLRAGVESMAGPCSRLTTQHGVVFKSNPGPLQAKLAEVEAAWDEADFPDPRVTRRFSTLGTARSSLLGLGKIPSRRYRPISS